jgi:heme-degrading monooxygenase HmoA
MVLECALMKIEPGKEAEFEVALGRAREVLSSSEGFRSLNVSRGIEEPSTYMLLIEWNTLEDHIERFWGSELFKQWRALIGPYFAEPPDVKHYNPLESPPR